MQTHRPTLTQRRLQRLVLWTLMLLYWMAAILAGELAATARRQRQRFGISLPRLRQVVGELVIVRAGQLAPRRRKAVRYWLNGRDPRRPHLNRSALGARLRRKLNHRNTRTCIAHLIAVVRNLDAYAAALAHRLRRGLTRVWRNWAPLASVTAFAEFGVRSSQSEAGSPPIVDSS